WLVRAPADEPVRRRRDAADAGPAPPLQRLQPAEARAVARPPNAAHPPAPPRQPLWPAGALRVRGRHNAANALAALALATAIGCPLAPMLHGLREYGGEPPRGGYIATVNGGGFVGG